MKAKLYFIFCRWCAVAVMCIPYGCRQEVRPAALASEAEDTLPETTAEAAPQTELPPQPTAFARVAMTGDIMPGTTFPDSVHRTHLPAEDGKHLFVHVTPMLRAADAAFGNLETTLLDSGGDIKKCKDPKTYYVFRTPTDYIRLIEQAGYDALSIANNHTNDLGEEGRTSTRNTLKTTTIAYAGHSPVAETTVFRRNGVTFGFCAFSVSPLTPDLRDTTKVGRIVRGLRDKCQILVVSFHGGREGLKFSHLPFDEEEYLGRKQGNVVKFARQCIDNGADVVFGHGPHLPRAIELYKGHLIAYSLGNFCTPYRVSLSSKLGYAPLIEADLDTHGHFKGGQIHSFMQQRGLGPLPDSLSHAAREIKMLTESDFPHTPLRIHPDGRIEIVCP